MDDAGTGMSPRIVATRVFHARTGNEVIAVIYEPVETPPDDWKCEFRISGLPQEVAEHARGMDSLQALLVAAQGVRAHLEAVDDAFTWSGGEAGVLGIPRPIPDAYGLEVEKHLEKLVNDEVTRLAEERRRSRRANPKPEKP
jgi:hypothetical protein